FTCTAGPAPTDNYHGSAEARRRSLPSRNGCSRLWGAEGPMRTQLLFALALMCGGGAASAQQPPASAPGYPGGAGASTDTTSSFSRYAAGSARAADAAAKEDAKEAAKIQLTGGAMA